MRTHLKSLTYKDELNIARIFCAGLEYSADREKRNYKKPELTEKHLIYHRMMSIIENRSKEDDYEAVRIAKILKLLKRLK